jgi:hypothetical protein
MLIWRTTTFTETVVQTLADQNLQNHGVKTNELAWIMQRWLADVA